MSTTIYNGYLIDVSSFEELQEFCQDFKKKALGLKDSMVYEYLSNTILTPMDQSLFPKIFPEVKKPNYPSNVRELESRILKDREETDIIVNFHCSAIFFYVDGKFICTFYGSRYQDLWQSQPKVKDFHYQDRSDPPEDVPLQEFEDRGRIWEKVLQGEGKAKGNGFEFLFADRSVYGIIYQGAQKFLDYQPPKSLRVKHLTQMIMRHHLKEANLPYSDFTSFCLKESDLMQKTQEEVISTLPERYFKDDLDLDFKFSRD